LRLIGLAPKPPYLILQLGNTPQKCHHIAMMASRVLALGQHLQSCWIVVLLVAVAVMNLFLRRQAAAEKASYHEPMFVDVAVLVGHRVERIGRIEPDFYIATCRDRPAAAPIPMIGTPADCPDASWVRPAASVAACAFWMTLPQENPAGRAAVLACMPNDLVIALRCTDIPGTSDLPKLRHN
jgi:hypothetical protein